MNLNDAGYEGSHATAMNSGQIRFSHLCEECAVEAWEHMTFGGIVIDPPHAFTGNFVIWLEPLPSPSLEIFGRPVLNIAKNL